MDETDDPRPALGLRRIINAAGTMTELGASAATPEAIAAAAAILPWFVEIDDLQRLASRSIAAATGAEAGMITACASAGVTLGVAACMTRGDPALIARLPDATGIKARVAVQRGHLIDYGAPIEQAIRLAGAIVVPIGDAASVSSGQLDAALDGAAAALFVVSHHTGDYAEMPLAAFVAAAHAQNIPVIVDAAAEYDLRYFIHAGSDLVVYSAHKFLGGLTAGILAGKKELVRAAYRQNSGIGRGMKVGKEGILATIAAVDAWNRRDPAARASREAASVALWQKAIAGRAGIRAETVADPTGNPVTRLRVHVGAGSGTTAWDFADALAAGERPIMVRDDDIGQNFFDLDPCNLRPGEAGEVAERLAATTAALQAELAPPSSLADWRARRDEALAAWPDRPQAHRSPVRQLRCDPT